MANSNLVEVTKETADTVILEQYLRYRVNQNDQMNPEFIILLNKVSSCEEKLTEIC